MNYPSKLPFKPKWSRKVIEKKLAADYNKMSYSRFMWWRSYCLKNPKLSAKEPFRGIEYLMVTSIRVLGY